MQPFSSWTGEKVVLKSIRKDFLYGVVSVAREVGNAGYDLVVGIARVPLSLCCFHGPVWSKQLRQRCIRSLRKFPPCRPDGTGFVVSLSVGPESRL